MFHALLNDESGFVVSAELTLIITLVFTAVAVGIAVVRDAMVTELNDVSEMIGAVSQSYNVTGLRKPKDTGKPHGECSGFGYNDQQDVCDCKPVLFSEVCGKDDPSGTGIAEGQG
jgi:hypothetical protein